MQHYVALAPAVVRRFVTLPLSSDGHNLPDLRRLLRDCNLGQRQNLRQCKGNWGHLDKLKSVKHGHLL